MLEDSHHELIAQIFEPGLRLYNVLCKLHHMPQHNLDIAIHSTVIISLAIFLFGMSELKKGFPLSGRTRPLITAKSMRLCLASGPADEPGIGAGRVLTVNVLKPEKS